MNRVEFIARLGNALSHLPSQEKEDILNDYEEHFRISAEMGNTEEQTAQGLGSPEELGATYTEGDALEGSFEIPQAPVEKTGDQQQIWSFEEPMVSISDAPERVGQDNPFPPPNTSEPPNAPKPEEYGDSWVQEEVPAQEAPLERAAVQVPPGGDSGPQAGYRQQEVPETGYGAADHQSGGYYDNQGYFHPDGEYDPSPDPQSSTPPVQEKSQSQGKQVLYTVLLLLLTIFVVLPVGGGFAIAVWALIFAVAVAAGCAAVTLFLFHIFNVGLALLGGAALCLCVALFLGLVSYTVGAVKLAGSYFKMCSRVISGRKETGV